MTIQKKGRKRNKATIIEEREKTATFKKAIKNYNV